MELLKMTGQPLMEVFTSLETIKYLTSNDCLLDKRMKYFEEEATNTNENT